MNRSSILDHYNSRLCDNLRPKVARKMAKMHLYDTSDYTCSFFFKVLSEARPGTHEWGEGQLSLLWGFVSFHASVLVSDFCLQAA
jgi:hypothetical protein